MNYEATHYHRDQIQQLLDHGLPEPLATDLTNHLSECDSCRAELESLASDSAWWTKARADVRTVLENPAAYSSNGHSSVLASANQYREDDEAFVSDFAVDFLSASDDPAMLGRLGEYDILGIIGRGGMGIVFKGFQKELHRCVAVKVLAPHLALSAAARRRFEREAQATAAVVHPHVMAIHSVAANAKLPYLVMPFMPCESLQQRLDRHGPLDVKDILRIGLQAAHGLAAAHAQGLVHRDVKPANILLETNVDRVMLTDFGLARAVDDATLTRTGIIAGTPLYMSPEQANGDPVDHRSDLFSLGSVLYAMCTGRPPFRAETTFGVLRRIREAPPHQIRDINSEIPDWLERLVVKLLAKSPDERPFSASDVATLLEQCLAHVQQPLTTRLPQLAQDWTIAPDRQPKRATPSAGRWLIAITLLGLMIGGGVLSLPYFLPPDRANHAAQPAGSEPIETTLLPGWNELQPDLTDASRMLDKLIEGGQQDLQSVDNNSPPE